MIVLTEESAAALSRQYREKLLAKFRVGQVVRCADGDQGVIQRIYRAGDTCSIPTYHGDIEIRLGDGHTRVTNRYSELQFVPRAEQTMVERVLSTIWSYEPFENFEAEDQSLPGLLMVELADLSDEEHEQVFDPIGDWPDSFEELSLAVARVIDRNYPLRSARMERERILYCIDAIERDLRAGWTSTNPIRILARLRDLVTQHPTSQE